MRYLGEEEAVTRRRWGLLGSIAVCAVLASVLAGLAQGRTDHRTASSKYNPAYLRAQIAKYMALPKFIPPGPAFDAKKAKGKTIFSIPVSSANPFTANIETAMAGAAKLLGIKFVNYTNQAQVPQWVQGMGQAISRHVDLIDLLGGTDPRVLGPQIAAAKRAHIPTATSHLYDITQTPVAVNYSIPADYQRAARLEADWVILDTKGKADVVIVTSNEIVPTPAIVKALKSEFAQQCGSACKLSLINAPVADWSTKIQPQVQSALVKDPNINYVIPIYDSMSQFVVPAITAANRTSSVHIATYNGTPFVMGYLAQGKSVRFEVGENLNWLGWAYIDAEARVLAGVKIPRQFNEHTALRAFTPANIKEAGNPPKLSTGYGNAYVVGYRKLWGIK
jgi:ribose transport system substrate-binding protein